MPYAELHSHPLLNNQPIAYMSMQSIVNDRQGHFVQLYQLASGIQTSSHSFHVARHIGLPEQFIQDGESSTGRLTRSSDLTLI
jgi:DNA mismatch repair ATPase MutS